MRFRHRRPLGSRLASWWVVVLLGLAGMRLGAQCVPPSIDLDGPSQVACGETITLTPEISNPGEDGEITNWSVDDASIATVTEWGEVVPLQTGTVTVTVEYVTASETYLSPGHEVTVVP